MNVRLKKKKLLKKGLRKITLEQGEKYTGESQTGEPAQKLLRLFPEMTGVSKKVARIQALPLPSLF